jgi:diacylglycerol kinase (ATP)
MAVVHRPESSGTADTVETGESDSARKHRPAPPATVVEKAQVPWRPGEQNAVVDRTEGERPAVAFDRVAVVVNPAAGQDVPVLSVINSAFHAADVDWDVFVTKKAGDGTRYAKQAVAAGYPVVAVYGGDGTVGEVASGLIGTRVPLAIFPGGTANVMSVELGIPSGLVEASALVFSGACTVKSIDVGQIGERHFLLRAGIGFEAMMVGGAGRKLKGKVGTVAYALSALQALRESAIARYHLIIDGHERVTEGLTGIVANTGSLGRGTLTLSPTIDVSDGLLDVVVMRKADLASLLSVAASVLSGAETAEPLQHWQCREVTVRAEPEQPLTIDGEMAQANPITARVLPGAVQVVVPIMAQPR